MKNDIYKPVLFQTTMRKHNRAEGGVVGMGQKDLRLNRTACLMQRLMLAAFFALAVSALAVGISQGPWQHPAKFPISSEAPTLGELSSEARLRG